MGAVLVPLSLVQVPVHVVEGTLALRLALHLGQARTLRRCSGFPQSAKTSDPAIRFAGKNLSAAHAHLEEADPSDRTADRSPRLTIDAEARPSEVAKQSRERVDDYANS